MTGGLTKKSRADVGMVKGRKKMKEKVDRILNGDIEELTSEGFVFSILKDGDYIDIIPEAKEVVTSYSIRQKLTPKDMRELAGQLTELAEELESRKRFKNGDEIYFVTPKGSVFLANFNSSLVEHLGLVMSGNAFKTREEACDNIPAVMAKYQELRDKGLV